MTDPLDWNYLELEDLIMQRLEAKITGPKILAAADLQGVTEQQQFTPAVHVIYFDDVLGGGAGDVQGSGSCQIVGQRWLTVVAVRNVRDPDKGTAARAEGGPLIQKVIRHLGGWEPGARWGKLKRVQGPKALFTDGFMYIPILWKSEVVTP